MLIWTPRFAASDLTMRNTSAAASFRSISCKSTTFLFLKKISQMMNDFASAQIIQADIRKYLCYQFQVGRIVA